MGRQFFKRPLSVDERSRIRGAGKSTAASTALAPNQLVALQTTSTADPVVYTIADGVKAGDVLEVQCNMVGSSSGQFHLNAQSSGAFGYSGAGTAQDMLTLSTVGMAVRMTAINSSEWLVVGTATFSTST